nr:hypothetical protein [Paenibacillus xylanexedens]
MMKVIRHDGGKPHALVLSIEHNPTDYEQNNTTIRTDVMIPLPEPIPGMDATLMIDTDTNTLFYNYTRPEVLEDRVAKIAIQQDVIKTAIDDLIMGGAL